MSEDFDAAVTRANQNFEALSQALDRIAELEAQSDIDYKDEAIALQKDRDRLSKAFAQQAERICSLQKENDYIHGNFKKLMDERDYLRTVKKSAENLYVHIPYSASGTALDKATKLLSETLQAQQQLSPPPTHASSQGGRESYVGAAGETIKDYDPSEDYKDLCPHGLVKNSVEYPCTECLSTVQGVCYCGEYIKDHTLLKGCGRPETPEDLEAIERQDRELRDCDGESCGTKPTVQESSIDKAKENVIQRARYHVHDNNLVKCGLAESLRELDAALAAQEGDK